MAKNRIGARCNYAGEVLKNAKSYNISGGEMVCLYTPNPHIGSRPVRGLGV